MVTKYHLLPFLPEIGILETDWKPTKQKKSKGIKKLKFPDHSDEDIKGPLQCYRCGDIFKSLKLVQDHLTEKHKSCRKIHYGKERQYQCHICKAMFKSEEQKSYHRCRILEENQEWGKNYCKICELSFPGGEGSTYLRNHNLQFHITEKNFVCDLCDYKVKYDLPYFLT